MSDDQHPVHVGGCLHFPGGVRIQLTRCWACMFGQCPGGWHPWADVEDIEHARAAGRADPSVQACGCTCVIEEPAEPDEPEWSSLNATPCEVCGEVGACGYDAEGRPMIHATDEDES